ncbi:MAG: YihY family inner membrane protein [Deltaproteobacteria bacterium]|nr:YihY family inner membrane protein [Deltaproteobacteria bacterium]
MELPGRLRKFSRVVRQTVLPGGGELGRGERRLATLVRFLVQLGRQFVHDRCPRQAGALAFGSVVAFVPIAAVLLVLTQWAERLGDRPALQELLERFIVPGAAKDLAEKIAALVGQIDFETIGWVGGVTLVLLGGMLYLQVEVVLNDVWNATRARRLWERALALVGVTVLAVPAFGAATYLSFERLQAPLDTLLPFGLLLASLTLVYKLMPHLRVRWRSAMAGALVAGLLLALGHAVYGVYVDAFGWTYESVYGALAFLPITLAWVYLGWVFFLLGAEVSYTSQHLDTLWARARHARQLAGAGDGVVGAVSWTNAVRLCREVAAAAEPVDAELLALRVGIHIDAVGLLVSRLVEAGLLRRDPEGRVRLARPAAEVALADVYDAVVDRRGADPVLQAALEDHREALRGLTLAPPPGPSDG